MNFDGEGNPEIDAVLGLVYKMDQKLLFSRLDMHQVLMGPH